MRHKQYQTELSFEVFPPNTEVGVEKLFTTLSELKGLEAAYISVTCSNSKLNVEETTVMISNHVQNTIGVPAVAHLPAAYLTKGQVFSIVEALDKAGITRMLALRGDFIDGKEPAHDFKYASELISFIKAIAPHFEITGACYPETHPNSANAVEDIRHLKAKVDAGCDRLITQLFFDNEIFYNFVEKCDIANIEVPIVPGVMPVVNQKQALRLFQTNSTKLPRKFKAILERYEHHPEALRDAGIAYAVDQIVDLVTQGVPGIHLYTMNSADTAKRIYNATHSLFKLD